MNFPKMKKIYIFKLWLSTLKQYLTIKPTGTTINPKG